jgi:hypothetical protein
MLIAGRFVTDAAAQSSPAPQSPTASTGQAAPSSQGGQTPEPPSWGAMEPGQGFEVVKTDRGDLFPLDTRNMRLNV